MDGSTFISGFGGVIVGGGVLWILLKAKFDRLATLEERVERSVDAEIGKLALRITTAEKELRGMNTAVLERQQKTTLDVLHKMERTLEVVKDTTIEQGQDIKHLRDYVGNVHGKATRNEERLRLLETAQAVSDATQRIRIG